MCTSDYGTNQLTNALIFGIAAGGISLLNGHPAAGWVPWITELTGLSVVILDEQKGKKEFELILKYATLKSVCSHHHKCIISVINYLFVLFLRFIK